MQSKKSLSNLTVTSSLGVNFLSGFIDSLLKDKRIVGEGDYSEAIARMFISKACEDEKSFMMLVANEILIAANRSSIMIGEAQYIAMNDLTGIIDDLVDPAEEMINERIDEMESEMSWTEVSKYKELCGE